MHDMVTQETARKADVTLSQINQNKNAAWSHVLNLCKTPNPNSLIRLGVSNGREKSERNKKAQIVQFQL